MAINAGVEIRNTDELHTRIRDLDVLLAEQEHAMKKTARELHHSFQLTNLVKSAMNHLKHDREFKADAIEATLNVGADLALDSLLLKKGAGIRNFLLNAGLKKLVSFLIAKNRDHILAKKTI